jgi:hypothetical protein
MASTAIAPELIIRPPIQQPIVGSGLCRTCVKAPECTFPRSPGRIVRHCDEFEGAEGPRTAHESLAARASVFPAPRPAGAGPSELKGLCAQCARRHSCTYPKLGGGVWHCNELI